MKKLFWDDYYEMPSTFGFVLILVVISMALIVGVVSLDKNHCLKAFEAYSPQWGLMSGCRIEFQGRLTPVNMIKNINI